MTRLLAALMDPFPHRHVRLACLAFFTFSLMALIWAGLMAWIRADIGGPGALPILSTALYASTIMALWVVLVVLTKEGVLGSLAVAALLVFLALTFAPALALVAYGRWVLLGLALLMLIAATLPLRASLRLIPGWQRGALMLFALLGAVIYALAMNAYTYSHVFGPEAALSGTQHADPLFHAALAEMLITHGRISTGLDGLVFTGYHILSHLWFGLLARMLDVSVLVSYMLVPQIIGIPLLLFAFVVASAHALPRENEDRVRETLLIPLALGVLALVEIKDWYSYLASESYLFAMIGALFGFAALAEMLAGPDEERHDLRRDLALSCLTLLLMAAKVSVGAVFAAGVFWAILRHRRLPVLKIALGGVVLAVIGGGILWGLTSSAHSIESTFEPLHFLRAYADVAYINLYLCLGLITGSVVLWFMVSGTTRKRLEVATVLVLAALIPALLLRIGGGSAYYFMHVGTFVAMAAIAAVAAFVLARTRNAAQIAFVFGLVAMVASVALNPRKSGAWATIETRAQTMIARLAKDTGAPIPRAETAALRQPIRAFREHDLKRLLLASVGAKLNGAVSTIALPMRKHVLIHIPPENTAFWSLHAICRNAPLHVPAITGMAMLKGLPEAQAKCDLNVFYGYPEHAKTDSTARALTDDAACSLALAKGFSGLLILPTLETPRYLACQAG